jgi:hypothetical protein
VAGFIAAQRVEHAIPQAAACRALGISPAWFYKWVHGDASPRRARRARLAVAIKQLFAAHRGTYGSPRITADLREAGWRVSQNTVAQLMREQHLLARAKKRRKSTTRPGKGRWRAPDLIGRDFGVEAINQKWYGDGTELPTDEGKLYLASVLDMGSRRVVGFAIGQHHDAQLAYAALAMAVAVRGGCINDVIMHTDQGSEGGFNWSSQHLDQEVFGWDGQLSGWRQRLEGRRCGRRVGRRLRGVSSGSGSGRRLPAVRRVRPRVSKLACRRPWDLGGSANVAACHRQTSSPRRAATCPLPSARRSRSAARLGTACARSPAAWVGRRRRSRGNCGETRRQGVGRWFIER